jgi:hypothetical protein
MNSICWKLIGEAVRVEVFDIGHQRAAQRRGGRADGDLE